MSSHKARRIGKELADIAADTQSNIRAESVGDSITTLKGSFDGPSGTPFEGGVYDINIQIPNEYPFKPPIMKFATKIWHPNISSQTVSWNGCLCFEARADSMYEGSYLSRYTIYGLVTCADHQVRVDLLAISSLITRTKRPTRCRSGTNAHNEP